VEVAEFRLAIGRLKMRFKNPQNSYMEEVSNFCILWTALFGPIYFLFRGVFHHALISFFLAVLTWGLSNVIYAFAAPSILENHYMRKGWERVE